MPDLVPQAAGEPDPLSKQAAFFPLCLGYSRSMCIRAATGLLYESASRLYEMCAARALRGMRRAL